MAKRNNGAEIIYTRRGNETDLQVPVNPRLPEATRSLFSSREKTLLFLFVIGTVGASIVVTVLNHIAPMPSWP